MGVHIKPKSLMNDNILSLPGYTECGFLLVLQPHEELWNHIKNLKEEFAKRFECPMATFTKPHITLVMFQQYEMMEPRIIQRLQLIAMSLPAFKVDLKDFGSFPSHTIYINVMSKIAIVNMVKAVRQAQRLMKINNDKKPYFITEPHLIIARKLLPWQYEKAWLEYERKNFTGRFIAQSMLLLKRRQGNKSYQIVERFPFQNLPVEAKQGQLF
ncbi:MAG: 2'-5' RNA ligase family protein [Parafilimonas sp.]